MTGRLRPPTVSKASSPRSPQRPDEAATGTNANVASVLWRAAEWWPRRTGIIDSTRSVDYGQLRDLAASCAEALIDAGTKPGDRVGVLHRRSIDAAAAFFGVLAVGATAVVISDALRARQVEQIVRDSGARVLLADSGVRRQFGHDFDVPAAVLQPCRRTTPNMEVAPRDGDDLAQLVYTSGSTGLPKGVMVSHANLHAGIQAVRGYLGIDQSDRIAALLPFSFDYGLNQLLLAVAVGAALVIERSPIPARIDATLRSSAITVAAGVPYLWRRLLQVDCFRQEPIATLRTVTSSGGRLAEPIVRQLRSAQPQARLYSMYGLTEAFRSTYLPPERADVKPTSVGRAIPGAEVQIRRSDGTRCRPYEVGEIVHRGPTVAHGYWKDPAATAAVFRPVRPGDDDTRVAVWSGDLGWIDDDGDLYVFGRRDQQLKRNGLRTCPDQIADAVLASGLVRDVCVVPCTTADEEEITAHVVLHDAVTAESLEGWIAAQVPRHLRPSRLVAHRDELPVSANGKHDLAALHEVPE